MACQIPTSPNRCSHALAAMDSPKSCAARCVALLTCRSLAKHCYAGIRTLSRWGRATPPTSRFNGFKVRHSVVESLRMPWDLSVSHLAGWSPTFERERCLKAIGPLAERLPSSFRDGVNQGVIMYS